MILDQLLNMIVIYDIISLCLLAVVLFFMRLSKGFYTPDQKFYLGCSISLGLTVVFDILVAVLDKQTFSGCYELLYFSSFMYYLVTPSCMVFWIYYIDAVIYADKKHLLKSTPFYLLPFVVNIVLCFVNIANGMLFKISPENEYQRGSLFFISILIAVSYFLYTIIVVVLAKIRKRRRIKLSFILILIPPVVGSMIQAFFYGISLNWICISLTAVLLLIHSQSNSLSRDYLTELYNRRQLVKVLNNELKKADDGSIVTAIMLDIDKFKSINDTFGHAVGDEALQNASLILKKSCTHHDYVFRYAGDEFVILLVNSNTEYHNKVITNIHFYSAEFNAKTTAPYTLSFSLGFMSFRRGDSISYMDVLKVIDENMYKDKESNR